MKLTELNGAIYDNSAGREGIGVSFDCPCGCQEFVAIPFTNPLDGGAPNKGSVSWERTGDTLENLTLRPSLQRLGACRWHGYLTDGEFKEC